MVGKEGFVGSQLVLGVLSAPWLVVVQGAGSAGRMPAAAFGEHLEGSEALQTILKRYVATLMTQFAIAAPCLRFHDISQRLARWLLMTHDRAQAPQFKATHEYLSYMLGVRRAGVTEAAGELQRLGAIHYDRGVVHVLDRTRLEAASCGCYAADCASYKAAMEISPG
jgi:CRP-like cAMP-binding protein